MDKATSLSLLCFLIFTILISNSNCQTQNPELEILLQLKSGWGNPPALESWNSNSTNHCTWQGITCSNGSVTEISLPSQNLNQSISDSICELKNLEHLDLGNNTLLSKFPVSLYNCSSLKYLDLSQNYFVGTLPSDLDKLSHSLTFINLGGNNFTGDIPVSIGRLKNLKYLHLEGNLLNGTYPKEIGSLTNLEYLSLAWNSLLPAPIPPQFGNLTNLKYLWMTRTHIIGEIPSSFSNLMNLEHFDLAWNNITGRIPPWIWSFKNLQILYLYSNKLSGEINITGQIQSLGLTEIDISINNIIGSIPNEFGKLKNLSVLHLYYNHFSGEIPSSIGLLPQLGDIRLFNNNLSGSLPPELGKYSKLGNFEVSNNNLSGEIPPYLCSGQTLTSLVLFNNNFMGKIPKSLDKCNTLNNIQLYNNKFYGEFPLNIWSINNLQMVLIHDNEFNGRLPKELPWNLTRLEISNNYFTGEIPSQASGLQYFSASNNSFYGEIPSNLMGMSKLTYLALDLNHINGSLPYGISVLKSLNILNLSKNEINGYIPDSIGSLSGLTMLDLSNNEISGSIPQNLNNLKLNFLNLSVNHLSGVIPHSLENQVYNRSFLSNPNLCIESISYSVLNLPICRLGSNGSDKLSRELIAIFATLGFVIFVGIMVILILLNRARKRKEMDGQNFATWESIPFHKLDFNEYDILNGMKEENVIGSGGAGKVYKIQLLNGEGLIVAVKKIFEGKKMDDKLEKTFKAEVDILGKIRHANIVKLLCCMSSSQAKLLVYEYMENTSLDRWLYGKERIERSQSLDWPTRLRIAIDSAKGLCYMHHGYSQPIMHRDIKSSNILLDSEFRAKIADFGLARELDKFGELESVSRIQGSFGYIAPECGKSRKISEKVDVYSFGVVLLELTTGKKANEGDEFEALADWALRSYLNHNTLNDLIDEDIRISDYLLDIIEVFKLGLKCTSKSPLDRPTMKIVLQCLSQYDQQYYDHIGFHREIDERPLIISRKGSRKKSIIDDTDDDKSDNDSSGSFVVHVV
ncbi:hypothetical protein LUZ60_012416 [Juncus effusus]|nr:hypothetical protein LUZ60_012416 [Juncus effusus]